MLKNLLYCYLHPNRPNFSDKKELLAKLSWYNLWSIHMIHVVSMRKKWLKSKILIFMAFYEVGRFSVTDALKCKPSEFSKTYMPFLWCSIFCFIQTWYHYSFCLGMECFRDWTLSTRLLEKQADCQLRMHELYRGCGGMFPRKKSFENWALGNVISCIPWIERN